MHKIGTFHHTEEAKQKIREAMTNRIVSQETRNKLSKSKKGIATSIKKGDKLSKKHRENISKALRGEKSRNWKGGRYSDKFGYILIKNYIHPFRDKYNYVPEHRLVMEKLIGRYLKPKERVHHINSIKFDNRIENLKLFSNSGSHIAYHHQLRREKRNNLSPPNSF